MSDIDELLKEAPTLTFEPVLDTAPQVPAERTEEKPVEPAKIEEEMQVNLTPEEQKMVDDFAAQIDITNTQQILQYGAGCQKKIADFSETALGNVRTKDMGEVGEMLTQVVAELKSIEDEDESKGFFGVFKKKANQLSNMKAKYDKAEVNVNKISEALEAHQITLLKDVAMLDKMYELNLNYFKELSMYILAGKQKLKEAMEKELPALVEKAEKSKLPEDTQAARDFSEMCNRFEKKIHDLELTRMVSLQMAPQIRLIQNNDTVMSDKIQSTLVNTIPLWKSQMVIAIGLSHSTDAAKAQREVSDMTNELLKKNAENLKTATIETAKESERGIVDIETLQSTNQTLISTLDEVLKIQEEGREKRRNAEAELQKIESEMRDKLLELSTRQ
ncbi:MAG: toxic anion resistance protein [Lachnospiraceae bacterium]|nr:toxic anion resistance protein [Lachnospiraceae bacterium]